LSRLRTAAGVPITSFAPNAKKKISADTHRQHETKPYCEDCYATVTDFTCRICQKSIDHRHLVESLGFQFHLDCFVCCVGDHKIGNKQVYYEHLNKMYCKKHWEEAGLIDACAECGKGIEHDYVKVVGKCFHTNCWKCSACKKVIQGKTATQSHGLFFCVPCGKKATAEGSDDMKMEGVVGKRLIRGYGEYEAAPGTVPPWESKTYPLSVLLLRPGQIPKEIDFRQREQYLEENEFKQVFKVDMQTFNAYPLWRRLLLKKEVGLF